MLTYSMEAQSKQVLLLVAAATKNQADRDDSGGFWIGRYIGNVLCNASLM
jgi:hypothetical protein